MFKSERARGLLYQGLLLAVVIGIGWYLVSNTLHNLASRQIQVGFGFLTKEAGFEIAEKAIAYEPTDSYGRAFTVGLVNTASMANNNSPFVSPWDIASVTATGAARGLIVGKTLGVMAGLRPESQQNLMRAGIWGGLLTAVVPNAFPAATQVFGQYLS